MSIRSAEDVMAVAKARGFVIHVDPGPPPMPFLRGNRREATPALIEALRVFRLEIIEAVIANQQGVTEVAS